MLRHALLLLLLASVGCSRKSGTETPQEAPSVATSQPAPSSTGTEAPPGPSAILTPEDVEPEVEHRITEENLERELDRLEREIQAE